MTGRDLVDEAVRLLDTEAYETGMRMYRTLRSPLARPGWSFRADRVFLRRALRLLLLPVNRDSLAARRIEFECSNLAALEEPGPWNWHSRTHQLAPLAQDFERSPGESVCIHIRIGQDTGGERQRVNRLVECSKGHGWVDDDFRIAEAFIRGQGGMLNRYAPPEFTQFELLLPRWRDPLVSSARQDTAKAGGWILLVDTGKSTRELGVTMLRGLGRNAIAASSESDALEVLNAQLDRIAAVVLDLKFPLESNDAFASSLRRLAPTMPLLLTATCPRATAIKAMERLRASAFLAKPWTRLALAEAMASV